MYRYPRARASTGFALGLVIVMAFSACGGDADDEASTGKPKRDAAIHKEACSAVQDLWTVLGPYFGDQGDDAALKRSALRLADVTDKLRTIDPAHSPEFVIAGIVAFGYRNDVTDSSAALATDLGAVWSETMFIVARTCNEWGVKFDLGEEGG